MLDFITKMFDNGNLIDIISCVFTVAALIFTLYFWLLDHLGDEESEFIKRKSSILKILNKNLEAIKVPEDYHTGADNDTENLIQAIDNVNKQMEVVLSYRFWERGKHKETYQKVNDFYQDSKYAVSTLKRSLESDEQSPACDGSLVSIATLKEDELEDIRSDYQRGLSFTIEFIENWE